MIVKNVFAGKDFCWPTHTNSLLIDRKDTEGTEAFLTTIQPEGATHRHSHEDNEQLYYVISGRGVITCRLEGEDSDKETELKKEDAVFIPVKAEHKVACAGKSPLVYLTVDVFPRGKPEGEPTWESHASKLVVETGEEIASRVAKRQGS